MNELTQRGHAVGVRTSSLAALLRAARQQSSELAEVRAGQAPALLGSVRARTRRRPWVWSIAGALMVLGGASATWAVVGRLTPAARPAGARAARPAQTLGALTTDAARTAGPAPLTPVERRAPVASPEVAERRPTVAPTRPTSTPAAPVAASVAAPVAAKAPPVVLDPDEVVGPDEAVIIVMPKAKHRPLWTPESFGKIIRNRMLRSR